MYIQEKSISDLETTVNKGIEKSEGPFVKALDRALASFNVERQAYYSGTFVGNHVHACLKVQLITFYRNTMTVPSSVTTAQEYRHFMQGYYRQSRRNHAHSDWQSGGNKPEIHQSLCCLPQCIQQQQILHRC